MPVTPTLYPIRVGDGSDGPWATVEIGGFPRELAWPEPTPGARVERSDGAVVVTAGAEALAELGARLGDGPGGTELRRAARALLNPPEPLRLGRWSWAFGRRTYLLGIVNATSDSFSGDGVGGNPAAALERARALVEAGADGIDLGGESSRPGHREVPLEEELARVVPAVTAIAAAVDVPVFVDTAKSEVAAAALAAGAVAVNDIWGLRRDPGMAATAAAAGAGVVCMHNQDGVAYQDLRRDLSRSLNRSLQIAQVAGIPRPHVVLDPGLGFGKTPQQSLEVLSHLAALRLLGAPLMVGSSRKSMIGWLLGNRPVEGRLLGTAATVAWAAAAGADIVRVHDVAEMRDVVRVIDRLRLAADS